MRALILVSLVALAGCSEARKPLAAFASPAITTYELGTARKAVEFKLSDGTRCVALPNSGLTCEWKPTVVMVGRVQ